MSRFGEFTRRAAVIAAAATVLAGCGQGGAKEEVLHIYNWSDYIDPAIVSDFTKETGIKVVYDTFDSQEVMETKLLTGGTGYDLVVPANNSVPRLIQAGVLQKLDKAQLSNFGNLWPDLMARMDPFDPGAQYTAPYMWGTIGIGYNVDAVKQRLPGVAIDSWDVVFRPENIAKLKDCGVYMLDASEDMFTVALAAQGKNPNSLAEADYAGATDMLLGVRPSVRKFHSSEYINALANGDICLAVGFSGDVFQAKARADEAGGKVKIDYVIPREGTQVYFDVFAIPADAPNPAAALKFMNYMLRPEVAAKASNYVQFANANQKALDKVDPEIRDNPNIYPTPEVFSRLFVATSKDPKLVREINRQWTRVVTGR